MDIACGLDPRDPSIDWTTSPYLIGVQLPHWATAETSGGWLTPVVLDALIYILDRADKVAARDGTTSLPVVVNLSYGKIAGPHDGTELLESAIDQLIASRPTPLRVVLPAGNHYLARCHTCFELRTADQIETLQWRVQPDNRSASFMEIWLPYSEAGESEAEVEVRITTPEGAVSPGSPRASAGIGRREKKCGFRPNIVTRL